MRKTFLVFCFSLCSLAVSAQNVTLLHLNTQEGRTVSRLLQVILEERMGLAVQLQETDAKSAFTAVARGNADAFIEAHLPMEHKKYFEKHYRDLTDCGCLFKGAQTGLVVPAYVDISRISELNTRSENFKKLIFGTNPEAPLFQTTEQTVIPRYGLDFAVEPLTERKMLIELQTCINIGEWVVITGWSPHWMFARWDLKFLKQDLDKLVWQSDNIHIVSRKSLALENPEVNRFLCNISFTDEELNGLLYELWESIGAVNLAVERWSGNHEELIQSWMP